MYKIKNDITYRFSRNPSIDFIIIRLKTKYSSYLFMLQNLKKTSISCSLSGLKKQKEQKLESEFFYMRWADTNINMKIKGGVGCASGLFRFL